MKFWEHTQKISKDVKELFGQWGTNVNWDLIQGTYYGDKKIKGAGIDITIFTGSPNRTKITKMLRARAKIYAKGFLSEQLKSVTVTQTTIDSERVIVISCREY